MKKLITASLLFSCLFFVNHLLAANELHRCYLLPVSDSIQGTLGDSLFIKTEELLKLHRWCEYQPDPKLHSLLKKYNIKLEEALSSSEVLTLVANKTQAGTVIRIGANYIQQKMRLTIDLLDAQGRDYLYRRTIDLENDSIEQMMEHIAESLQEYAHDIPYSSIVKERVENDLILKVIDQTLYRPGDILIIEAPIAPKKHPLLNKVVEWQTDKIGEAEVRGVYPSFISARLSPLANKKASIGQWGKLLHSAPAEVKVPEKVYARSEANLIELYGAAQLLSPYASNNLDNENEKIQGKIFVGGEAKAHLRLTKAIWTELQINTNFGLTGATSSCQANAVTLKLGYRYHPMPKITGNFLAPYMAYQMASFDYNSQDTDNFVPTDFSSYQFGVLAHYQFKERYTLVGEMAFALSSDPKVAGSSYSGDKTSSAGMMEIALRYAIDKPYELTGGLTYQKHTARFAEDELSFASLRIFTGIIYKY